jgi:hypothetical protein
MKYFPKKLLLFYFPPLTDDLIKVSRKQSGSSEAAVNRRRKNIKSDKKDDKPTTVQTSIAQTKARRDAAYRTARREGADGSAGTRKKATLMDIDKEVDRVRKNKSLQQAPQRKQQALRGRPRRAPSTPAGTTPEAFQAPTKKAVSAAVQAMKEFGFQPPKGMDVVISFAPKETKTPNFSAAAVTTTKTAASNTKTNPGRTSQNQVRGGGGRRGGRSGRRGGGRKTLNNDTIMG